MTTAERFEKLSPFLSLETRDRVLLIRCTDDFALLELDLESKNAFQALFSTASTSADIGAVVLLATPKSFGPELMDRFWRHVLEHDTSDQGVSTPHAAIGATDFRRGETGIQQLAANVRGCNKAVVIALQGEVVTPFLGASLVCDFRVVADSTVFCNRAYQFGMPPGGALTYLLPAYIGFGRASELLLEGRDIPADEALRLGIVNRVVPAERLEAAALGVAARIAANPPPAVAAVKILLTQALQGLTAHYELETSLINRCMHNLARDRRPD